MFDIATAINTVFTFFDNVVKRVWPDATETEKAKIAVIAEEMKQHFSMLMGQIEINKLEAQSPSVFVSGARPFILWICGVALAYASVVEPILRFVAVVIFGYAGPFPKIDSSITLQILGGMLGLSGYRSFEKYKGIARMR